jgi:hypothetical protein
MFLLFHRCLNVGILMHLIPRLLGENPARRIDIPGPVLPLLGASRLMKGSSQCFTEYMYPLVFWLEVHRELNVGRSDPFALVHHGRQPRGHHARLNLEVAIRAVDGRECLKVAISSLIRGKRVFLRCFYPLHVHSIAVVHLDPAASGKHRSGIGLEHAESRLGPGRQTPLNGFVYMIQGPPEHTFFVLHGYIIVTETSIV